MVDDKQIAKRAYEIWEGEGRPHGRHAEHWQKAAAELSAVKPAGPKARVTPARKKAAPVVVAKNRKTK